MALQRVWMPTQSYSSRGGAGVRIIVLHTAEGARTIESLGGFFANTANQVSSHTGADDKLGKIGEYVTRGNKAWTAANYNPVGVQLELCGFAEWSTATWKNSHHNMLRNCADWIAEEAKKFGLPITELSASQAQGGGRGVCQHIDLGAGGGGHVNCGPGFPMGYVLDMARGGSAKPPGPDTTPERYNDMFYLTFNDEGNAAVVVPNYYADGKARLRLGCEETSTVRVNLPGYSTESPTIGPGGTNPDGAEIPKGCKYLVVRRDSGTDHIAACFSK